MNAIRKAALSLAKQLHAKGFHDEAKKVLGAGAGDPEKLARFKQILQKHMANAVDEAWKDFGLKGAPGQIFYENARHFYTKALLESALKAEKVIRELCEE